METLNKVLKFIMDNFVVGLSTIIAGATVKMFTTLKKNYKTEAERQREELNLKIQKLEESFSAENLHLREEIENIKFEITKISGVSNETLKIQKSYLRDRIQQGATHHKQKGYVTISEKESLLYMYSSLINLQDDKELSTIKDLIREVRDLPVVNSLEEIEKIKAKKDCEKERLNKDG